MVEKSIQKNMTMSVLLTSASFIFPLITFSYVTKVLSPEGTGRVAFVSSIISYFSFFAALGIPTYGLREAAKIRDDQYELSCLVQELLVINSISTLIAYLLLFFLVSFIPKLYSERLLFAIMSCSIFLQTIGIEWLYQALEEYSYITIRSLFFKVISMILTFVLIKSEKDYLKYGVINVFTNCASYVFNFVHVGKYVSFNKKRPYNLLRHVKPILTLFTASMIITVYNNFDISMIGLIKSNYEVGLYNAALKIKTLVLSLSSSVTSVIVPRMSYYFRENNKEKITELIEKSLRVSFCLAIPIAVYIFLFGEISLCFFCGEEYADAVPTLRVLMICIIPLVLTSLFGNQILIPSGGEKRFSKSVLIGLIINLSLNIFMIPKMGSFGAALGTFFTECWNVFYMSGGNARPYRNITIKRINCLDYVFPLFISLILVLTVSKNLNLQAFWYLVFTSIVFFGTYYFILLTKKDPVIYKLFLDICNFLKIITRKQI